MSLKINVLHKGRAQSMFISQSQPVAKVLLDVCAKLDLAYNVHGLKFQNKPIKDLGSNMKLNGIPNNARLELYSLKQPMGMESVTAVIQLPDGSRQHTVLRSDQSLYAALTAVGAESSRDEGEPVVHVLNEIVKRAQALQRTTLFSLGVLRGKTLLKVRYEKFAEAERTVPEVPTTATASPARADTASVLAPTVASETPALEPIQTQPTTTYTDTAATRGMATDEAEHTRTPAQGSGDNTHPPAPAQSNPATSTSTAPTTDQYTPMDMDDHRGSCSRGQATGQAQALAPVGLTDQTPTARPSTGRESREVAENTSTGFDWADERQRQRQSAQPRQQQPTTLAQMTGLSLEPSAPVDDAEAFPLRDFKFPTSDTSEPDGDTTVAQHTTPVTHGNTSQQITLAGRNVHIFSRDVQSHTERTETNSHISNQPHEEREGKGKGKAEREGEVEVISHQGANATHTQEQEDLPDEMFKVTAADLRVLLRDTRMHTDMDRPFQFSTKHGSDELSSEQRGQVTTCIRLMVGDHVAQIEFKSTEPLSTVVGTLRLAVDAACSNEVIFFTTPPRCDLKASPMETLWSCKLISGVIVHARIKSGEIAGVTLSEHVVDTYRSTSSAAGERLREIVSANACVLYAPSANDHTPAEPVQGVARKKNGASGGPVPKWLKLSKK